MKNYKIHIEITYFRHNGSFVVDFYEDKELNTPYLSFYSNANGLCDSQKDKLIESYIRYAKDTIRLIIDNDEKYNEIEFYETSIHVQ